jgi:hypothetical protein
MSLVTIHSDMKHVQYKKIYLLKTNFNIILIVTETFTVQFFLWRYSPNLGLGQPP